LAEAYLCRLYCAPGEFHIDPIAPVPRAVITHGHADHARAGHGATLSTPETAAIMALRYGKEHATRIETALTAKRREWAMQR